MNDILKRGILFFLAFFALLTIEGILAVGAGFDIRAVGNVLLTYIPKQDDGSPQRPGGSKTTPPAPPPPVSPPAGISPPPVSEAVVKNFQEPLASPPTDGVPPPLNIGSTYQEKAGDLGVLAFYLSSIGKYAHTIPTIKIKTKSLTRIASHDGVTSGVYNGRVVTNIALCDPGYKVLSCSGSRHRAAQDTCDEGDCALVGVVPVDATGKTSTITAPGPAQAVGCKVGISQLAGTEATVTAYCICTEDVCL